MTLPSEACTQARALQLSVDDLKGDNVAKWRAFCARLEHVRNYNFGSLLRLDAQLSYSDENTVLVPYVSDALRYVPAKTERALRLSSSLSRLHAIVKASTRRARRPFSKTGNHLWSSTPAAT